MIAKEVEQKIIREITSAVRGLYCEAAIEVLESVADHCTALAEAMTEDIEDNQG